MGLRQRYFLIALGAAALAVSALWLRYPQTLPFGTDPSSATLHSGSRSVPVVLATAGAADFPIERDAIGFMSSPAVANVNARVESQVVTIAVSDGQMVKVGDLLFNLDDRVLKAQLAKDKAALAKDQAALLSAQGDLKRAKDLVDKGVGTQQAYDEQLATTNGLVASVEADQAAIDADAAQLGFATITAPISGRLGVVNTNVGDLVGGSSGGTLEMSGSTASAAPSALVTITQLDPLQVTFNLPEVDLPLLQKGLDDATRSEVTLKLPGSSDTVATGRLDFIDTSVDTTSGTIAARASIPNHGSLLWPGLYVDVTIRFGTLAGAVSVPTVAVQQGQDGAFLYVVDAADKAAMRKVTVSVSNGGNSAITDGLRIGEKVVVEGQGRLRDGASVFEAPAAAAPTAGPTQ